MDQIKNGKPKKIIRIILIIAIFIVTLFSVLIYNLFFNMNNLPTGEFIKEVQSPNWEYSIKAYVSINSLSSDAVRAEVVQKKSPVSVRTLYWDYKKSDADIEWLDNNNVIINGHKLNILSDKYDFRRH